MSTNLINHHEINTSSINQNNDSKSNNHNYNKTIEGFEQKPGFFGNNQLDALSFSALNIGDKNIHNNVFSNLVNNNQKMIAKKGFKFNNLNKIDTYFYNENSGDGSKCAIECEKLKNKDGKHPCTAFEYNIETKKCSLYNTIPNGFEKNENYYSGYKNNYNYNMKNLTPDNQDNIISRIGSFYMQKKSNIVNTDLNKNLNKCIHTFRGYFNLNLVFYFYLNNNNKGKNGPTEIYLNHKESMVSQPISMKNDHVGKYVTKVRKEIQFRMKSYKADTICFKTGNNSFIIKNIHVFLNVNGFEQYLFNINMPNYSSNTKYCIKLPKLIDLNSLSVSLNSSKVYFGNNLSNNKTIKYNPNEQKMLDSILKNNNFSINVEYTMNYKSSVWRNIFHYGNSNNIREPSLFIFPNEL